MTEAKVETKIPLSGAYDYAKTWHDTQEQLVNLNQNKTPLS